MNDLKSLLYKLPSEEFYIEKYVDIFEENEQKEFQEEQKLSCILVNEENVNTISLNDFTFISKIGQGTFGKVFLAEKKDTQKLYAIKQLKKSTLIQKQTIDSTYIEHLIMRSKNHPFLASSEFTFQTDNYLYLVMKYFRGGEIFAFFGKSRNISEERIRFYGAQITCAVGYLHENGIIYRDLKPENILLDEEGYVALTDFGLAKILDTHSSKTITFCGTPDYISPEMIKNNAYDFQVDWWSLGIFLYEMTFGVTPFFSKNLNLLYRNITKEPVDFPKPQKGYQDISLELKDIIRKLLDKEPKFRLGNGGAKEVLNHPFFKPINIELLMQKKEIFNR